MIRIGVLALQGAVSEHIDCLKRIENVESVEVKKTSDLQNIDGLILPGGESTTMGKLLVEYNMVEPIHANILKGMPVWGTCAGMILLAENIVSEPERYLQVLDVSVRRNGYGGQLDSFQTSAIIPKIASHPLPLIFIRAPYIEQVGNKVEILLTLENKVVAVEQDNILATSFHPELTRDLSFHKYFVSKTRLATA